MPTFLDLPREIRDAIYDAVFEAQEPFRIVVPNNLSHIPRGRTGANSVFSISYERPDTALTQGRDSHRPHGLKWLLGNKQICEEAIKQFQRKAVWTMVDPDFIPPEFSKVECCVGKLAGVDLVGGDNEMRGRWANPTPRNRKPQAGHCLFLPSAAQHISVQMELIMLSYRELDGLDNPVFNIGGNLRADRTTQCLASELSGSHSLQTLSIYIRPTTHFLDTRTRAPFHGELGQVHRLHAPSLRKIEFRVYHTDENFGTGQHFVSALEEVLNKTSKELIGGEAIPTYHTDHDARYRVSVYTYTRSINVAVQSVAE